MKRGLSYLALLVTVGCASDLAEDGAGKACAPVGRCAAGFVCHPDTRLCVRSSSSVADAATSDSGSDAPSADGPESDGPSGDASPDAPADASVDAVHDAPSADANCDAPTTYFADSDLDGFGDDATGVASCAPLGSGWVTQGGDCSDKSADAFPGQTQFFSVGYAVTGGNSFDYDCSGQEVPDATQFGAAPSCGGLAIGSCSGSGFAPTARSGAGVNPLCGSTTLIECKASGISCGSQASGTTEAKRCR